MLKFIFCVFYEGKRFNKKWDRVVHEKDRKIKELRSVISLMPGNVYLLDTKGVCIGCNDNLLKITGIKFSQDILGKCSYDLMPREFAEITRTNNLEVIKTGRIRTFEERGINEKKQLTSYITQKKPLRDFENNIIGVLGVSFDITECDEISSFRLAKQKAEEADKFKTEFILNMEHDLRTPASGISSVTEILARSEKNLERKKILTSVSKAASQLLNIFNELLKFREMEGHDFSSDLKVIDLQQLVSNVMTMEDVAARAKSLELISVYDENIPQDLYVDEFRVRRILTNLLGNAIKFTRKGHVKVGTKLLEQKKGNAFVNFSIEDTGVGIEADKHQVVFDKFVRLNMANTGEYQGMGLGLHAVKELVSELGGSISLNSDLGIGSIFHCSLPFKIAKI